MFILVNKKFVTSLGRKGIHEEVFLDENHGGNAVIYVSGREDTTTEGPPSVPAHYLQ